LNCIGEALRASPLVALQLTIATNWWRGTYCLTICGLAVATPYSTPTILKTVSTSIEAIVKVDRISMSVKHPSSKPLCCRINVEVMGEITKLVQSIVHVWSFWWYISETRPKYRCWVRWQGLVTMFLVRWAPGQKCTTDPKSPSSLCVHFQNQLYIDVEEIV